MPIDFDDDDEPLHRPAAAPSRAPTKDSAKRAMSSPLIPVQSLFKFQPDQKELDRVLQTGLPELLGGS